MGKKTFGEYYLGLDIGTDSVGWAVTNKDYDIERLNGKALWGVRAFDEATPAVSRRQFRIQRRRLERRHQRIVLLQELFASEIEKIDPEFFLRLHESRLQLDDRTQKNLQTLFDGKYHDKYIDQQYHQEFPTIYHLRKHLMETKEKPDLRLLYLGIHHILKNRGHFLFDIDTKGIAGIGSMQTLLASAQNEWEDAFGLHLPLGSETIETILKDRNSGIKEKASSLEKELGIDKQDTQAMAFIAAVSGKTFTLSNLFNDPSLEEAELNKISLKNFDYEENRDALETELVDNLYLFAKVKGIYDLSKLSEMLGDEKYLSWAKIRIYEQHKKDLALLKKVIKKHLPLQYKEVFNDPSTNGNYCAYVGYCKKNGHSVPLESKRCDQVDFNKYINGLLSKIDMEDPDLVEVQRRTSSNVGDFMPKIISKENGVIPYQLHAMELDAILDNAVMHYPFLNESNGQEPTTKEKIHQILQFRIPYYVGPLNPDKEGKTGWMVRKEAGQIRPWNFNDKVDLGASAEKFITRMTSTCTYLRGEDVLPKQSLLYSRYMVLNELNNIRIDGERMSVELKQKVYEDLFRHNPKITMKKFKDYLKTINSLGVVTGIDGDFQASLKPYMDMAKIFETSKLSRQLEEQCEDIIRWIVLFGDAKDILKHKIQESYAISEGQLSQVLSLRYSGWGRLSKKFLSGIQDFDLKTGEVGSSIIEALWDTQKNLMELLSQEHQYTKAITDHNESFGSEEKISYETVQDLYVSPVVKRQIWQALTIVDELHGIMQHDPKKVFIEMARQEGEKKRTTSRKDKLLELYKALKMDERDWVTELGGKSEGEFRRDRLYLYYRQMGRCMYTGKPIDLANLYNETMYDIDHIYPQSKVKDDSLVNRVLVDRLTNTQKGDVYPIVKEIRDNMRQTWNMLRQNGLLEKEKHDRLMRSTPFSDGELADFIARQLVETRQSTKAVAQILQKVFPTSKIVYVKAGMVSEFRQYLKHLKSREVNDFHHAKDAYLNIVAGNIHHTKFTESPSRFIKDIKDKGEKYSMKMDVLLRYDIRRGDEIAWNPKDDQTKKKVIGVLNKNNILFTRYAFTRKGQLFDVTLMKKGQGQHPIKEGLPIDRYGGYNKVKGAYFILVEHDGKKGARIRTLMDIPIHLVKTLESDGEKLKYCEKFGMKNPSIRYSKIKIKSLLEFDGMKMHLTGRSNNSLLFSHAHQLVIPYVMELYIKNLSKFVERDDTFRKFNRNSTLTITKFDDIDTERNTSLFDLLVRKLENTVYSRKLKKQGDDLLENRDVFIGLSLEEQSKLLLEVLKLLRCNRVPSDLSALGKAKSAGMLTTNSQISTYQDVKLINQSPTGVFEEVIDLLKV